MIVTESNLGWMDRRMMERRNWTRNELIVAFNLYCRIPFGRIHNRNPEIIELAAALGRTPSALSWKLANFARFDPTIHSRNLKGASHGAKLEQEIWNEFNSNWNRLVSESERIRRELLGVENPQNDTEEILPTGETRTAQIMARVNQGFFRSAVLAAYEFRCCITGLAVPELLSASHIIPWSADVANRTNPRNGLCLNALHDRAFDRGLIAIGTDYKVIVSSTLERDHALNDLLSKYEGVQIQLSSKFRAEPKFLEYHRDVIFQKSASDVRAAKAVSL